jgi:hypothetical protein
MIGVLGKDNLFFWRSKMDIEEIDEKTIGTCTGQVLFFLITIVIRQLRKFLSGQVVKCYKAWDGDGDVERQG